jgi:hypothetical protein
MEGGRSLPWVRIRTERGGWGRWGGSDFWGVELNTTERFDTGRIMIDTLGYNDRRLLRTGFAVERCYFHGIVGKNDIFRCFYVARFIQSCENRSRRDLKMSIYIHNRRAFSATKTFFTSFTPSKLRISKIASTPTPMQTDHPRTPFQSIIRPS